VAKPLEGDRHESLIVEFVSVNDDDMRFWNDAHRAELARHRSAGSRIDGTPPLTPRRLSGLSDTEPGICDVLYSGWGRVSRTGNDPPRSIVTVMRPAANAEKNPSMKVPTSMKDM